MKNIKHIFQLLVITYISTCSLYSAPPKSAVFSANDRICFLGDSITHGQKYISYLYTFYCTRYPNKKLVLINCGKSGGTISDALLRLEWDVLPNRPDTVIINFGMNDVNRGYYGKKEISEELKEKRTQRLKHYKKYYAKLIEKLQNKRIAVVLVSPTPYDQTVNSNRKILFGVNDALATCTKMVKELAQKYGCSMIDLHTAMTALNLKIQRKNPQGSLIGRDRVHPHKLGHFVMACLILKEQQAQPLLASILIDAAANKISLQKKCKIDNLNIQKNSITFNYTAKALPFPIVDNYKELNELFDFTNQFNQEILKIINLKSGQYQLEINSKKIVAIDHTVLTKGLNLALFSNTPGSIKAMKIYNLTLKIRSKEQALRNIAMIRVHLKKEKINENNKNEMQGFVDRYKEKYSKSKYRMNVLNSFLKNLPLEKQLQLEIETLINKMYENNKPQKVKIKITRI